MPHRVSPAFAIVSSLLFSSVAIAQVAQTGGWLGPGRPQGAQVYAQPPYARAYPQPVYPAPAYPPSNVPTPAAYRYAAYGNGSPYSAPYYAQGNQVAAGSWGAPSADASAPLVKTQDNLHYVEMGLGAFVPTDQGNPAKLGLEASVWALHGGWVPSSGLYLTLDASTGFDIGCLAKRSTDGCKGHLRIHWIGMGPFFNTGTPMIAREVPRSWDLMGLTGAEVRLWKGMTAKATINWFLPSPWGVYAYEKELTEARVSGTAASPPATATTALAEAQAVNPMDEVESIVGHALKHPQLNLMAMWEF